MGGRRELAFRSLKGRGEYSVEREAVHCANRKSLFLSQIQELVSTHTLRSI